MLLVPSLFAQRPEKAKTYCDQANHSYQKFTLTELQNAVRLYKKALQEDSLSIPALTGLARSLAMIGYEMEKKKTNARAYYTQSLLYAHKALAVDSHSADVRRTLGHVYMTADPAAHNENAYRHLLESLRLDTGNAETYYLLWMLMHNDDPNHLLIQKSLYLDSTLFLAHYSAAVAFAKKKDFEAALPLYRRCIRINPDHPMPYVGLGNAYSQLKQYVSAIKAYQASLRLDPDYIDSYLYIGLAYYYIGEDKAAAKHLKTYLKKLPDTPYRDRIETILKEIKK